MAVIRAVIQLTYFNWFCNSCGEKYGSAAAKAAASESTLSDQLTELRVMVADCSAKVDEVKLVVKSETATMHTKKRPKPVHRNMHFPVVEADGKFDRKQNLIIAGVEEFTNVEGYDQAMLIDLCDTLGVDFDRDAKLVRLKKRDENLSHHPLIRVVFSNLTARYDLLKNASRLQHSMFNDIYIRPDLSFEQIAKNKILIAELKQRRGRDEDVIIKSGKVIVRPCT